MRACVRVSVRVSVRVCVRAWGGKQQNRVSYSIAVAMSSLCCELSSIFPRKYPLSTSLARNRSHPGPSHGRTEPPPEPCTRTYHRVVNCQISTRRRPR